MGDANSTFEERQAELATALENRDAQLRQHLDTTQRANNESLQMLQRGIPEHVTAKQREVDQLMATAMANLESEARKLDQQALYQARQAGPQSGGDAPRQGSRRTSRAQSLPPSRLQDR